MTEKHLESGNFILVDFQKNYNEKIITSNIGDDIVFTVHSILAKKAAMARGLDKEQISTLFKSFQDRDNTVRLLGGNDSKESLSKLEYLVSNLQEIKNIEIISDDACKKKCGSLKFTPLLNKVHLHIVTHATGFAPSFDR